MPLHLLDLEALLPSWELAMRAERKAPATIRNYGDGVRSYLRWAVANATDADSDQTEQDVTVANATVSPLTRTAVQAWVASLLDDGLEPATAHARLKGLRRFCAWLVLEGELEADPLAGIKSPRSDAKVVRALDEDQLRALIKACAGRSLSDRRDEAIIRLMVETGARASEIVGLETADVDLARGVVTIRRGKGGRGRVVPIGPQTALALDRYLRARRSAGLADQPGLWLGKQGAWGYYGLRGALKHRAATAGIDGFHLHLLRHTFATRWKARRGSDDGLMAVAGWSSRSMIDRYAGAAAAQRAAEEARLLGLGDL
jgi:site-specific recombinase XerC